MRLSKITPLISGRPEPGTQGHLPPKSRFLSLSHQQADISSLSTLTVHCRQMSTKLACYLQVSIQSTESVILVLFPNHRENAWTKETTVLKWILSSLSLKFFLFMESSISVFLLNPKPEDGWPFPIHSFINSSIHNVTHISHL